MKNFFEEGKKFGNWTLKKYINSGGNGEVWITQNKNKKKAAIKILTKLTDNNRYERFKIEIQVLKNIKDIDGIIPIWDSYLPKIKNKKDYPWYVMPYAQQLEEYFKDRNLEEILTTMIQIADTLNDLHANGISHRDIKPENLLFYKKKPCLCDFGLVDYPEKKDLTQKNEKIGPQWTIAPEMKRNPQEAKGIHADSYSLAKTLWIFITKEKRCFEGQYNPDDIMGLKNYEKSFYLEELEQLLVECTDNTPDNRPNMNEFSKRIKKNLEIHKSNFKRKLEEWKRILKKFFPLILPERSVWKNRDQIIEILNYIDSEKNLTHMFFPDGGGLDMKNAKASWEKNCIEIHTYGDPKYIIKPHRLLFEFFPTAPHMSYFRLETKKLNPVCKTSNLKNREYLTEISQGKYIDRSCYDYNDFNGDSIPNTARNIIRILSGSLIIFSKQSDYTYSNETYNGRHNEMNADRFRTYVLNIIKDKKHKSSPNFIKPEFILPKFFKKNERTLSDNEIKILNDIKNLYNKKDSNVEYQPNQIKIDDIIKHCNKKNKILDYFGKLTESEKILVVAVIEGGREYANDNRTIPLQESIKYTQNKNLQNDYSFNLPLDIYIDAGIKAYSHEYSHLRNS